jgi:hypothetical protein
MTGVLLRRVQAACPGAQGDDDYDVIDADGLVVGRILSAQHLRPWSSQEVERSPAAATVNFLAVIE